MPRSQCFAEKRGNSWRGRYPDADGRMRRGEMVIEKLGGKDVPGAMLHHWRGTAFVPGATGADFERLMRDFADYPKRFAPQVMSTKVLSQHALADHAFRQRLCTGDCELQRTDNDGRLFRNSTSNPAVRWYAWAICSSSSWLMTSSRFAKPSGARSFTTCKTAPHRARSKTG